MIFKQAQEVLDRKKHQARRPVKSGDMASHDEKGNIVAVYREVKAWDAKTSTWKKRLLWKVGKDLAVQPGRGKKSIGRTPPIKAIRRERLQEITIADCLAEGIQERLGVYESLYYHVGHMTAFAMPEAAYGNLWNSLHRKPYRWEDNPEVWVLEFEPIERGE